jgi:hypothetical protein
MRPEDLARELGIDGKRLRQWLRRTYPRMASEKHTAWVLSDAMVRAARRHFGADHQPDARTATGSPGEQQRSRRTDSDEAYVLDLCDELLGERSQRQHCFDWLLGDPNERGQQRRLPVDAYYPNRKLVIEYHERQHAEAIEFFDKPDRLTVSGISRGEQRRLYDQRRMDEIPRRGLTLVIINAPDLDSSPRGRLRRNREQDIQELRQRLAGFLPT